MPWVLLTSVALLLAAIVMIELRAIREGDERRHHAPGYALVMGGLVLIALGIAAAVSESNIAALALSLFGLLVVARGSTRHGGQTAH